MKASFIRAALAAALLSSTAIVLTAIAPKPAFAADSANKVGAAVGKPLSAASKAIAAKDYATALASLKEAQAVPNQTPFETYMINKFLAVTEINLQDAKAAMKPAEDAADSSAMPDEDKKDMLHYALLLSNNAQDYQKTVNYAKQLDQMNALDDETAAITAIAYYNLKDTASAKNYAQKSIDMAKAVGKQPGEAALQIVMSAQSLTDQGAAESTLEQIVMSYNRPDDWDQLVNVSLSLKATSNAVPLDMLRVLYIQGPMKTADDYTYLGNLAEDQRNSVEARNVLQAGISAGKIGSGAILNKARVEAAADEKIISTAMAAAQKSKRGEDGMQVAQDLWGYGRYADVEALAKAAQAKGGIKDPGEAPVLIGMAQIAQGNYDAGIATLGQVSGSAARVRAAHLWTLYAQSKQKASGAAAPATPPPAH